MFGRRLLWSSGRVAACSAAAATAGAALAFRSHAQSLLLAATSEAEEDVEVCNWSGTHSSTAKLYFQPDSPEAVQRLIEAFDAAKRRIRVVGSALSPNGIGLSSEGMLNMASCDRIVSVDAGRCQVTVQAGARVKEVVEALRPHGMTLENYASIAEQQIGGFLQVGAHGTGAAVPPVDEQVVRLRLHTPALGALDLSAESNPQLFWLAKVGLGALGVVSEVTIQCVPAHRLLERTYVQTRAEVAASHLDNLQNKHMRYMWIPHTDTVVVVASNPLPDGADAKAAIAAATPAAPPPVDEAERTRPLRELLLATSPAVSEAEARSMNFAQLRDALLALSPLDKEHVIAVNKAEAEFWKNSQGYRVDWSDRILGFECGGQQWVSEVAFPCGTRAQPSGADLGYMRQLLARLEASDLPAPAPIEQRWTARSRARMSIARSDGADDLHSWVGIIMYLPEGDDDAVHAARQRITRRFFEYNDLCRHNLWQPFGAHQHWAKIELPDDAADRAVVARRLRERFPIDEFNAARRKLDPNNILSNELLDGLFGKP